MGGVISGGVISLPVKTHWTPDVLQNWSQLWLRKEALRSSAETCGEGGVKGQGGSRATLTSPRQGRGLTSRSSRAPTTVYTVSRSFPSSMRCPWMMMSSATPRRRRPRPAAGSRPDSRQPAGTWRGPWATVESSRRTRLYDDLGVSGVYLQVAVLHHRPCCHGDRLLQDAVDDPGPLVDPALLLQRGVAPSEVRGGGEWREARGQEVSPGCGTGRSCPANRGSDAPRAAFRRG